MADCRNCPNDKNTNGSKGNTNLAACVCDSSEYYTGDDGSCIPHPADNLNAANTASVGFLSIVAIVIATTVWKF